MALVLEPVLVLALVHATTKRRASGRIHP